MPERPRLPWQESNPAGRLHWLFTQVFAQWPNHDRVGWGAVEEEFGVANSNRSARFALTADLLGQVDKARSLVEKNADRLDATPEAYLRWTEPVTTGIELLGMSRTMREVLSHFDPGTAYGLEMCAQALHKRCGAGTFPEQTSSEDLADQIDQVMQDVVDSDFPPELKDVLMHQLAEMHRAIRWHSLYGVEGLRRAFADLLGGIAYAEEETKRSGGARQALDNIENVALRIAALLGGVAAADELAQHALRAITH